MKLLLFVPHSPLDRIVYVAVGSTKKVMKCMANLRGTDSSPEMADPINIYPDESQKCYSIGDYEPHNTNRGPQEHFRVHDVEYENLVQLTKELDEARGRFIP